LYEFDATDCPERLVSVKTAYLFVECFVTHSESGSVRLDDRVVMSVGVVTVSGRLDYETFPDPKQISSVLTVSEPGVANKSVNATLVVIIEDINDNTPIFTPDVRNLSINFFFPFLFFSLGHEMYD